MNLIRRWMPLLILAAVGCTRSFQVYDVNMLTPDKKLTSDYLFYSLPRTVLTVDVPVTKTEVEATGPCTGYQFKDLRVTLLLDEPKAGRSFRPGKPVVGTRSEPDPRAVYAVDLKMRPFALTGGTFEMADNGVLTTAAVSQEDQALDAVLSVAKLALTATGTLPLPASVQTSAAVATQADRLTPQQEACAATAKAINEVRAKRLQVLSDALRAQNTNEAYLTAVLGKLDETEQALTSAFTGKVTKTVATIHCEWRPDSYDGAERVDGTPLFRFSGAEGPVASANAPCVIPASIAGKPHEKEVLVRARVLRDGNGSFAETVATAARPINADPRGFFYRIPASAIVSIDFGNDPRTREVKPVAQLGTVTTLPTLGGAFVRKAGMTPTLNAAGGLQKLVVNGEPGGNAAITGASDLVTSVLKAEADEEKAKAAANDELAKLERERKIIEEKKKIAEAEQRLAELAAQRGNQ